MTTETLKEGISQPVVKGTTRVVDKEEWVMLGNGSWFNLSKSPLKPGKPREKFVKDILLMKEMDVFPLSDKFRKEEVKFD